MTEVWVTIAALVVATAAIKAAGPLFLGGRDLPPRATGFISLLPAALLAALVVVETFGEESGGIGFDARAAGHAALRGGLADQVLKHQPVRRAVASRRRGRGVGQGGAVGGGRRRDLRRLSQAPLRPSHGLGRRGAPAVAFRGSRCR